MAGAALKFESIWKRYVDGFLSVPWTVTTRASKRARKTC